MTEHLTELDLELARTKEADDAVLEHLSGCAECQERFAFLSELQNSMSLPVEPIEIPAGVDTTIAELIDERIVSIESARRAKLEAKGTHTLRRLLPIAAAASIGLVLGGYLLFQRVETPVRNELVAVGPDDINRDGRVDILDAFALAREIKSGRRSDKWDLNSDGQIDQIDVDTVAMAAVTRRTDSGR